MVTEENEVGSALHVKLDEEIRDVEPHGVFGDIQSAPDLFVGKVLQQSIEHLLLPPAQFRRIPHFEPPATGAFENRVHECRQECLGTQKPPAATGGRAARGNCSRASA